MIRTIVGLIVIIASILWLPLWLQIGLFVIAMITLSYRVLLLIPAIVADALYAPTQRLTITHFKMTAVVSVLLILWYLVVSQTRLGNYYVSKTK